jgi:hypothetical protein
MASPARSVTPSLRSMSSTVKRSGRLGTGAWLAERLLDHVRPGDVPATNATELVWVGEQCDDRVAEQVEGGLMTRAHEQRERVDRLLLRQRRGVIVVGGGGNASVLAD